MRAAVALLNPQAAGNGTTVDIHVRFEQLPVLQGRRGCSVFDIWGKNSSTAEQGWTAYGVEPMSVRLLRVQCAATPGPPPAPAPSPPPAPPPFPHGLQFHSPLFSDGMILQCDRPTQIWGTGAEAGGTVTLTVSDTSSLRSLSHVTTQANPEGAWRVSTQVSARNSTTVLVADSSGASASLDDVAWGAVLLCGKLPRYRWHLDCIVL